MAPGLSARVLSDTNSRSAARRAGGMAVNHRQLTSCRTTETPLLDAAGSCSTSKPAVAVAGPEPALRHSWARLLSSETCRCRNMVSPNSRNLPEFGLDHRPEVHAVLQSVQVWAPAFKKNDHYHQYRKSSKVEQMAASDLESLIDWSSVECLNQKPGHTIQNALKQV